MRFRAAWLGLGVVGLSVHAHAQSLPRVDYHAPAGCPDAAAFAARLRALAGSQPMPATEATYEASLTRGSAFTGELLVHERDGAKAARRVSGASCEEVADALAFVTILALGLEPTRAPPAAPRATRLAEESTAERSEPPKPAPREGKWRLAAGVDLLALGMVGPSARPALGPFVSLARDGGGGLAPEVRLVFAHVSGSASGGATGDATLTRSSVRLDACPLRLEFGLGLGATPCASLDAGALSGTGAGPQIASRDSQTNTWIAAGLGGRLGFRLWSVLEVEAGGQAQVPFVRDRFYFGPNTPIYEVPAVGGLAFVGLAASIF